MIQLERLAAVLGIACVMVGCAPSAVQPSGFLGDSRAYALLTPDSELEGVRSYREAPYFLAGYDSILVPPVMIYLNEKGGERGISNEDLRELAEKFRSEVIKELGQYYHAADVPASKTAVLRLAITDADPNISLLNIHPGSLLLGGGLGGATAEAEVLNAESGERVAAFLASSKGKKYQYVSGLTKWGHTEAVLAEWAKIIGERFRKSRG